MLQAAITFTVTGDGLLRFFGWCFVLVVIFIVINVWLYNQFRN